MGGEIKERRKAKASALKQQNRNNLPGNTMEQVLWMQKQQEILIATHWQLLQAVWDSQAQASPAQAMNDMPPITWEDEAFTGGCLQVVPPPLEAYPSTLGSK